MVKIKTLSFSPLSISGRPLHSPFNVVVSHLMTNFLSPSGLRFTHQTLSSAACVAVSISQSPNPPFSLPRCLNSSPTGLPAFPREQSTAPVSKHFYPSVFSSHDKNGSPYSQSPPDFPPDLTTHLTSFLTLSPLSKTRFGRFVQSLGLFIYLRTFILPVLLVESVLGSASSCVFTQVARLRVGSEDAGEQTGL